MVDFTVAICTHNGENRLPEVLERLRSQIHTEQISWEILVIDNNSTDRTAKVVQDYQSNWSSAYPLTYGFEPQKGLAFARQRAVTEAKGRFIGFLDDDNLPNPEWVAVAYSFGQEHPKAGAYNGCIKGEFEVNPPEDFEKVACFLAIVDRGSKAFIYERYNKILPPGSGLVVRQQAWLENVPSQLILKGRVGESMLASEDLEALSYIQNGGWEIWYNPQMQIAHKIPHWRMERNYLISVVRGIGLARHHIRMIRLKVWQRPFAFPIYIINDLRKFIYLFVKYQVVQKADIAAACDMEFSLSSLISPFYLWSQSFKTRK
jgi:glycosyltransferase involved in cell wall biosynthesis